MKERQLKAVISADEEKTDENRKRLTNEIYVARLQLFQNLDEGYVHLAAGILFRDVATYPEDWQAEQLEELSKSYSYLKDVDQS